VQPETPIRPAWLRWSGLSAVALVLSAFAWMPMLAAYPATQGGDGPFYHKMIEAARVTVVRFHELPLWNPYECGGVPLWDNPQGVPAAPMVWASLLLGTTRAIELWYVVHSAIGFLCMWALARHEVKLSRGASFVAAASWAFSGVHNQHYTGGHFTFVPYLYFPLAVLMWRRAERDLRMAVGAGAIVALTMLEGGVYPLPHLLLLLGAETLTRAWPPRRLAAIVRAGVVVLAVGIGLGATRFLPVIDQLRTHVRPLGVETDAMQWSTLKDVFLSRDHGRGVPGQEYVWPEFGDYVGPFLLALAGVGMLMAGAENAWVLALLGWAFVLMLGHFAKVAPWSVLKGHVFPFKEMRVPSRFVYSVGLWLSVCMGIGIDRLTALGRRWLGRQRAEGVRLALLALGLVGVGDMIAVGIAWCAQCFNGPPEAEVKASPRLYIGGPGTAAFLDQPRQNRSRLDCWEEWAFTAGAPLWQGDVPQARAEVASADVHLGEVVRTPNTYTFDVDAPGPARILVNGPFDRGWRTSVGTLADQDKQLVLDVPGGHHHVRLHYWPHGMTLGLWLTALSSAGIATYFVRGARRRRHDAP
jgi:hypothetical protein